VCELIATHTQSLNYSLFFTHTYVIYISHTHTIHTHTHTHTQCMGLGCRQMVPESVFAEFIPEEELVRKHRRWLLDGFVDDHPELKWCVVCGV
jgi:hypothetical protein